MRENYLVLRVKIFPVSQPADKKHVPARADYFIYVHLHSQFIETCCSHSEECHSALYCFAIRTNQFIFQIGKSIAQQRTLQAENNISFFNEFDFLLTNEGYITYSRLPYCLQ